MQMAENGRIDPQPLSAPPAALNSEHGCVFTYRRRGHFFQWLAGEPGLAAEHRSVYERCATYPVLLRLDTRVVNASPRLDPVQLLRLKGLRHLVDPRARLAQRFLLAPASARCRLAVPLGGNQSVLYEAQHRVLESGLYSLDAAVFSRPRTLLTQFAHPGHQEWWTSECAAAPALSEADGPAPEGVRVLESRPWADSHRQLRLHNVDELPGLPQHLPCRVQLSIPLALEGPGRLQLVSDGVDLDPIPVDLGCPGAQAVVASHLATDLSQLSVVRGEGYNRMLQWLRTEVRHLVAAAHDQLGYLQRLDPELCDYVRRRLPQPERTTR